MPFNKTFCIPFYQIISLLLSSLYGSGSSLTSTISTKVTAFSFPRCSQILRKPSFTNFIHFLYGQNMNWIHMDINLIPIIMITIPFGALKLWSLVLDGAFPASQHPDSGMKRSHKFRDWWAPNPTTWLCTFSSFCWWRDQYSLLFLQFVLTAFPGYRRQTLLLPQHFFLI